MCQINLESVYVLVDFLFENITVWIVNFQMAVAIAIPLDNGRGDIFLSICVAISYSQPVYDSPDGIDPKPYKTV